MSNDNGDENEESDENSEVVAINDGNYDELSNVDADIMIEFYAPWYLFILYFIITYYFMNIF